MAWDYCCCAIPILNVGAYVTLSEQFVLGILVGTLAFATPRIVGVSVPSFAYLLVLGFGYAFAAIQLVGFFGIFKEKPSLFRNYVRINWIVLYSGLAVTAAFIGLSASRHNNALLACEDAFFSETEEDSRGETICRIFCWISVGIMGGLWLLVAIVQTYLVLVLRNYGSTQRADHSKYQSIYSTGDAENIVLNPRSGNNGNDAWDARPSTDSWHPPRGGSYRDDEPSYSDGKSNNGTYEKQGTGYGAGLAGTRLNTTDQYSNVGHPSKAYTEDPGPTPSVPQPPQRFIPPSSYPPSYHTQHPDNIYNHPAEGALGRKTPRQQSESDYQPQAAYDPYYPRR